MTASNLPRLLTLCAALVLAAGCAPDSEPNRSAVALDGVPTFAPDPAWPAPLAEHWIVGPGTGIYVDESDPGRRWQKFSFTGTEPAGN
ncbi:MAG: hypothetical protein U5R14_09750 [Gemmatimonadota bacterium]|nr:hypothetical protein [Gemmatimonadota bacterium]